MRPGSWIRLHRRLLLVAAAALALGAVVPVRRAVVAARLLAVIRGVASGDTGRSGEVAEAPVAGRVPGLALRAIVYRPAHAVPDSAVILLPGVSEQGCDHPRLVALSRSLARMGFLVLTPDIRRFRTFQIVPPPFDEISFWLHEVRRVEGGRGVRRVGLAGVSFSATLALIVAAEPPNRGDVDYVLGIGAFDDLVRCSRFWFGSGPVTMPPGYFPTRYYARWILMLAASGLLTTPADRQYLESLLQALLCQKEVPPPPGTITAEGRRWHRLAMMPEDQEDPELARQITNHVAAILYPALATETPAAEIRCPVFLAHGSYDDLIPPKESVFLRAKILQARSYLLVSPFLTHTHPWGKPLGWAAKARASLGLFAFLYHLAGAVN